MKRIALMALVTFLVPGWSIGYETPVHELLTGRVFDRLQINYQTKLGIQGTTSLGGQPPRKLLQIGSIAEDDGKRPLNHFLNPTDNAPLTLGKQPLCGSIGYWADLWADGAFPENAHSIVDARERYQAAVVGPNPGTRETNLKELFLTLGHVVHLVQDMAQPEHTRNDPHPTFGKKLDPIIAFLLAEKMTSLYEAWALNNVPGNPAIDFDSYPTVRLPDYLSYFRTTTGYRGLADFTNRNFLTQDTNYGDYSNRLQQPCFKFDEPKEINATPRLVWVRESVLRSDGVCCIYRDVEEGILTSQVHDGYTGTTEEDAYHAVVSALDLETRKYDPGARYFSLADNSYLRRATMLIPRAVGYSAGIMEHLFRGEIDASWKRSTSTIGGYHLTITNKSAEALGSDATISAIYRATPAYFGRSTSDDTGVILAARPISAFVPGFSGLPPGSSVVVPVHPYDQPAAGDSLLSFERRVVVRGTLGKERDAVIGLVQQPQMTPRITWGFDAWLPPGTRPPYSEIINISSGSEYGAMNGALTYGSIFLRRVSPLYMNAHSGGRLTFWWGYPVARPSFLLVNGATPMNLYILISDTRLYDGALYQQVTIQPYEERVIELPSGIARFTILPASLGIFAIDDVSWE